MSEKKKDIDLDDALDVPDDNHVDPQTTPLASTPIDLAQLGLNQIAYVRQAMVDDALVWTIHSATGAPIGATENLDQAWMAVMQHGLEPVRVH